MAKETWYLVHFTLSNVTFMESEDRDYLNQLWKHMNRPHEHILINFNPFERAHEIESAYAEWEYNMVGRDLELVDWPDTSREEFRFQEHEHYLRKEMQAQHNQLLSQTGFRSGDPREYPEQSYLQGVYSDWHSPYQYNQKLLENYIP